MRILVVGAGFSGAVIARYLAEHDHEVLVVDERRHLAGNCHTERDPHTGIMVHAYGPHIFHTDSKEVWKYICRFGEMQPYMNRVKANVGGKIFSLPINLHTINQFFDAAMSPSEAECFISSIAHSHIEEPANFEEQALKMVGEKLYWAFFHGYTKKQWGVDPKQLPASVLKRLPMRFNYDDNYYNHRFQGIPADGYTAIVENILKCRGIEIRLNCSSEEITEEFDHTVYTGPIDRFFKHDLGELGYRTLRFEKEYGNRDIQGTAVINYCDADVPFTRTTEHKYFAPWEMGEFDKSILFREFSDTHKQGDIPFYPLRLVKDKKILKEYVERAGLVENVTFAGRLGTYSYLDMDVTISRALKTAQTLRESWKHERNAPAFVHSPV